MGILKMANGQYAWAMPMENCQAKKLKMPKRCEKYQNAN